MGNLRCPLCGENFSDTYKACPFCEEERAFDKGKPLHRTGKKRLSKRSRGRGAVGVLVVTALVAVVFIVVGYVFRDVVSHYFGIREVEKQAEEYISQIDTEAPTTPVEPTEVVENTPTVEPLRLGTDNVAVSVGDTAILTVDGGEGTRTWSSANESIATVADGIITGVSGGTTTVTVTAGEESLTCQVQVIGQAVSTEKLTISREDITLRKNESCQLKIKGNMGTVVWSSKNSDVAKVSANGTVTYVGSGRTTITATVDGQVLSCIVRCP